MDASGARRSAAHRRRRRGRSVCRPRRSPARVRSGEVDGGRRRPRPPRPHRRPSTPGSAPSASSAREAALAEAARDRHRARPASPCRWPACRSRSRTTWPSPARSAPTARRPAAARPERKDHPVVARLRKAGAVVVGITRAPELCLYAATDGPGTVSRNPWDTARSPAGSSGGSAAAVASGSVPLAHGNDGMGSLRLPAAACGLVTLKPGRGRGARPASAPTTGRAWRSTARWPPRWPTSPSRTRCWRGRSRPTRRRRTGRCGSRSPPGRRCPACVPTPPPAPRSTPSSAAARRRPGTPSCGGTRRSRPGAAAGALTRWMVGAEDDAEHLGHRPRRAAAAQPHARPDRPAGPPGGAGPAAHRGARSASGWSASSRTSTCCSAR